MEPREAGDERLLGLAGVTLATGALLLPGARAAAGWTPDSLEHLFIANALLHGSGFLDPVQYHYFLEETSPLPAFAVRAPVVPVLLTLPLAAGLDQQAIAFLHACWAVLVAALGYWLASRFMRPWAAAAALILSTCTLPWLFMSSAPFNEVTASLLVVAIVAAAGGVLRSVPGALGCAALVLIGWMTRPSLGVMVAAVAGGVIWHLGPGRALRHAPLHAFVLGFFALYAGVHGVVKATTGLAPYAGYGVALQHLDSLHWQRYSQDYQGAWAFIGLHAGAIAKTALGRIPEMIRAVALSPTHYWTGWLIPIGLAHAAARWRNVSVEQAVLVLATLGFAAVQMAKYSDFEPARYTLQMLQCGVLAGCLALGERLPGALERATARPFPARIAVVAAAGAALMLAGVRARALPEPSGVERSGPIPDTLCAAMAPDALVASTMMWSVHAACGNATIRLPRDHKAPGVMVRFLAERAPAYVLDRRRTLRAHAGLEEVARDGGLVVVRAGSGSPRAVWSAPPPIACIGRRDCPADRRERDRAGTGP